MWYEDELWTVEKARCLCRVAFGVSSFQRKLSILSPDRRLVMGELY